MHYDKYSNFSLPPPPPPIRLTEQVAATPQTSEEILWHIAKNVPRLRKWLIVNNAASPELLEYISQVGGPGVLNGFQILFECLDDDES